MRRPERAIIGTSAQANAKAISTSKLKIAQTVPAKDPGSDPLQKPV